MAIIHCRECKKEVSAAAHTCPHCGVSTPSQAQFDANIVAAEAFEADQKRQKWEDIGGKVLIGVLIVGFIASGAPRKILTSFNNKILTACTVEKLTLKSDVFLTNGQADAGISAIALVRKEERSGDVTVTIRLSSSEGDLKKQRTVNMRDGQRANVIIQFPEPTINAQSIQGHATCSTI